MFILRRLENGDVIIMKRWLMQEYVEKFFICIRILTNVQRLSIMKLNNYERETVNKLRMVNLS